MLRSPYESAQAMLIVMSVGPGESEPGESEPGESEPGESREAPPLPPMLLEVWPIVVIGFLGWLVAAAAAFFIPALRLTRVLPTLKTVFD